MAAENSRAGDRQTASMRIKLKYADVETFIHKYSANISRGGIFIATKQPKPVGTWLKFEFLLAAPDGERCIIRGEGQVQWTKEYDASTPTKSHGMGIKFTRLDPESQEIVNRALEYRASQKPAAGAAAAADTGPARSRADSTRPIAVDGVPGPDPSPSSLDSRPHPTRAPTQDTLPVPMADTSAQDSRPIAALEPTARPSHQATADTPTAQRDPLDSLADELGVDKARVERLLARKRARHAEPTAELERLLAEQEQFTATRAEALAGLSALLARRASPEGSSNAARDASADSAQRRGDEEVDGRRKVKGATGG